MEIVAAVVLGLKDAPNTSHSLFGDARQRREIAQRDEWRQRIVDEYMAGAGILEMGPADWDRCRELLIQLERQRETS